MTQPNLTNIEQRTLLATPGPWITNTDADDEPNIILAPENGGYDGTMIARITDHDAGMFPVEHNGAFIAHSRQDIPMLTEAIRAVLELHTEGRYVLHDGNGTSHATSSGVCRHCQIVWPCPTIREHIDTDN